MQCRMPPPINDDQLSEALDGVAEHAVLKHLAICPHCTERLSAARTLEQQLTGTLYRWDCPTPDLLAQYATSELPAEATARMSNHLNVCVRCQGELNDFYAMFAAKETTVMPTVRPFAQAARYARLMLGQATVLRGAGAGPIIAEAGDVTIFLDIQPRTDGLASLQGQLVATDQAHWEGALVELRQHGALVATIVIDALGSFTCAALPYGTTELRVTGLKGTMIVLMNLNIAAFGS